MRAGQCVAGAFEGDGADAGGAEYPEVGVGFVVAGDAELIGGFLLGDDFGCHRRAAGHGGGFEKRV